LFCISDIQGELTVLVIRIYCPDKFNCPGWDEHRRLAMQ